jgi:hypothetical protein
MGDTKTYTGRETLILKKRWVVKVLMGFVAERQNVIRI